jgi:hypothetical protein
MAHQFGSEEEKTIAGLVARQSSNGQFLVQVVTTFQ